MAIHSRAMLGALDQALTAAANFLLGVIVARMGGVSELGKFAFAYTAIVMASMVHAAMLAEIYSVDTSARVGERRFGAGFLLIPTLTLALFMVMVSQLLLFWGAQASQVSTVPFNIAMVMSTCMWSAKSYFYCNASPLRAVACSAIYGVSMLATALIAYRSVGAAASPFIGVAVGAGLTSLVWLPSVRSISLWSPEMRLFVAAAIKYARWSVPAVGLIWLANNGYYLFMPANSDIDQVAGLRAILNLLIPLNTLLVGASAALLPILAGIHREYGRARLATIAHRMAIVVLGGAGMFALLMAMFSARALGMVYGAGFERFATAMQVAAVLPMLWGVAVVYRASIRALGESLDLFKVYFYALVPVGITLMVVLSHGDASRAVLGVVLTQMIIVVGFIYRFVNMTRVNCEI